MHGHKIGAEDINSPCKQRSQVRTQMTVIQNDTDGEIKPSGELEQEKIRKCHTTGKQKVRI